MKAVNPIQAAYRSRCDGCDEDIEEGDDIVYLPDDEAWIHRHCAEREGYDIEDD